MDEGADKAPRRKRVSRACDRCRTKKDKCDGARPTCSACRASAQICSYDPHAKKRGLPEGYVRGLEKLWALSLCNIDGLEDTILSMLGSTTESASRRPRLISLWNEDSASESLHESWKTSRIYGALEKMLAHADAPPGLETGKRSRYRDEASGDWGFRVARSSTPLGLNVPRVLEPLSSIPPAKRARLSQDVSHDRESLSTLRLPSKTPQLLDAYFAATHSWFPIVTKHYILRASYLYANAPFSVAAAGPGSGNHAALWAILSYSISQTRPDSRVPSAGSVTLAKEYYTVSRNLIPSEKERYELGHIQALLLLTMVNMGLEDWTAAWLLSGQAIRMAIAMGLDTYSDTRRSDELRQGKAVFLGCFVVDSVLSFRLGRSPSLHPKDVTAVGLLEEDGLEEWNSWVDILPRADTTQGTTSPNRGPLLALSCFNRLVELASVLNKIVRGESSGPNAATFAQQLMMDLKSWEDGMPLGCRLIGPESIYPERHSALLPHQTYLGLSYLAALLWIYLRMASQEQELHRSQRPALEGAKKLLYRVLPMVNQHMENFRMCGLPPLFEFAVRTIAEQAVTLRNTIESETFPFTQWVDALRQKMTELSPSWPVYSSLVATIAQWQLSKDFPEALPGAFPETIGHGPVAPTNRPIPGLETPIQTHRSVRDSLGSKSERDYRSSSVMGISMPLDGPYMTPKDTGMENADLAMMDVSLQSPVPGHAAASDKRASRSKPDAIIPPSTDRSVPAGDSIAFSPISAGFSEPRPPTGDIDAIFSDLAYLDTTEWATSREAGLKDFGFLDDTTFQAFCHDPDRLVGSQPLVHPPSIADIWPPPGFFPEAFQEIPEETTGG